MKGNNHFLTLIASVVSGLWLVVIGVLFHVSSSYWYDYDLPKDSNALGDMLAGIFAPLAFFWLVVGYFIQANEFRLTRQEMTEQGDALEKSARQTEIANAHRTAEAEPRFMKGFLTSTYSCSVANVGAEIYRVKCLAPKEYSSQSTRAFNNITEILRNGDHLDFPPSDMVVLEFENRLGETLRRAYVESNGYYVAVHHFSEDEYHQFYRDVINESVSAFEVLREKIDSYKKST